MGEYEFARTRTGRQSPPAARRDLEAHPDKTDEGRKRFAKSADGEQNRTLPSTASLPRPSRKEAQLEMPTIVHGLNGSF
jgi:hypothetical protein